MLDSDPAVLGGTPVFSGTRINVDLIRSMLDQGDTPEALLEAYPTLVGRVSFERIEEEEGP